MKINVSVFSGQDHKQSLPQSTALQIMNDIGVQARKSLSICLDFVINMAYYRAGYEAREYIGSHSDFALTVNGNFLDSCVIDWCKLFGSDKSEKHHWKNLIKNHDDFREKLYQELSLTEDEFVVYRESMLSYRDKFVAHLDHDPKIRIPSLKTGYQSVRILYDCLHELIPEYKESKDRIGYIEREYVRRKEQARRFYESDL